MLPHYLLRCQQGQAMLAKYINQCALSSQFFLEWGIKLNAILRICKKNKYENLRTVQNECFKSTNHERLETEDNYNKTKKTIFPNLMQFNHGSRPISFQRIIKRSLFLWLVSSYTDSTHSSHVQLLHLSLAPTCRPYSDAQS